MEGLPGGFPLRHAWRRIFHQAGPWSFTLVNRMLWVSFGKKWWKMMKVCYTCCFKLVVLATKCFILLYTFKCALFAFGILLLFLPWHQKNCQVIVESEKNNPASLATLTCHLHDLFLTEPLGHLEPPYLWWMDLLLVFFGAIAQAVNGFDDN